MNIKPRKARLVNAHQSRRERDLFDRFSDLPYVEEKFHEYLGRYKYPKSERLLILKALDFARLAHDGQERDEGVPYITHPIRVANLLLHELSQMDADMICTALLHDVIEDCRISTRELKNNFNDAIASMVKTLSKDPRIENHQKVYYDGIVQSNDKTKLIKLCDRLDNLRSLRFSQNKSRIKKYVTETEKKYAIMAQSINPYILKEMKSELTHLKSRKK